MKLTRHQADVAVRRLADHYYDETRKEGGLIVDNTEPRFGEFVRKLSWQVGGVLSNDDVLDVLHALDRIARAGSKAGYEEFVSNLNCAVNNALDAAQVGANERWILRRSEPVSA